MAENLQELGLRVACCVLKESTRENGLRHRYWFAPHAYLGSTLLNQERLQKFLVSTADLENIRTRLALILLACAWSVDLDRIQMC